MNDERSEKLEKFIEDWHWDEKSYKVARELGQYLLQFINCLHQQELSEATVRKHRTNCWCIGILECQYGYRDEFSPHVMFRYPVARYEIEFKRKASAAKYAINSYGSTWRKLHKYTKALGYLDDK